ncbi:MAG: GTP pyrophosphokinase [Desulfobacterales bacterium]|nr:MAG: GTP pyrophosphokinase [Desulfobacterales bacterium]
MLRITDILDKVYGYAPSADLDIVDRAYVFSARVHQGQVRLSGEPYLSHPLEVAGLLADMKLDPVSIAAGLLHDVLEDTDTTAAEMEEIFGPEVTRIVEGVTKLSKVEATSAAHRQAESIRKMILAMASDIRVILIKLADRLHNMRTLKYHRKPEKQRSIARETLDIYAAIASRLGMYSIKKELEDIAFRYASPDEFKRIESLVAKDKTEREDYIKDMRVILEEKMADAGLPCTVIGRYKHFFSISQKMSSQHLDFNDIYDIIAFRIILDSKSQCYEALGIVHDIWKPIDKKFKDYIGRPKPNMYQSIHTTVIGPYGERVEIQLRTWEMDRVAKSGIAAHWSYKEGKSIDENISRRFEWIQNLLENQENVSDPDEFLEMVRIDLFPEEVHVFTPTGEIKSLPKGATPVDFAYLVHTEVGHRCVGAKVNGRMVPLRYELQTGDSVSIQTARNHHPSKDWLGFVRTSKARNRVRQWVRAETRKESMVLGRELLEKEFRKHKMSLAAVLKTREMAAAAEEFKFPHTDDLIAHVGYMKLTPSQVVNRYFRLIGRDGADLPADAPDVPGEDIPRRDIPADRKPQITVRGLDDILVRFGKCCQPVPGDRIIGFITRGRGVTVHRTSCVNALASDPRRQIEVAWSDKEGTEYPAAIRITASDRSGLLADVTGTIAKCKVNILDVHSSVNPDDQTVGIHIRMAVKNAEQLLRLVAAIQGIPGILQVERADA